MNNYSQFEDFGIKRENQINTSTITYENNKQLNSILNDRDMFNKFSNGYDVEVDLTRKVDKNNFDFDQFSRSNIQILNNKKSLINNPYVYEKKDTKINFFGSEEQIENYQYLNDNYNEMTVDNNINNMNSISNKVSIEDKQEDEEQDLIERDITKFDYLMEYKKNKEISISLISPFLASYMWKSLILLSKNPSTEKLLEILGVKKKEVIISEMKDYSGMIGKFGSINYFLPPIQGNGTINSNFINKVNEIFNIQVIDLSNEVNQDNFNMVNNNSCDIKIQCNLNYEFKIPFFYNPMIVNDYFLNCNKKIKIKLIELENVNISLNTIEPDIVNIEVLLGNNIIGFYYNKYGNLLPELNYDLIIKQKKFDILVNKFIFPKINRNKRSSYDKEFMKNIGKVHLGEIIYGNMYDLDISMNMNLNIATDNEINMSKPKSHNQVMEIIKLNHKCFYYIKDIEIKNRIICSGLINYV